MIFHPSTKKVSRYLDGVLSEATTRSFEAHLAKCPACRRKVEVLRSAARVCCPPKQRLEAVSQNVMARVGQADSLSYEKRWNTDAPILAEIRSVEGTVFIRNAANEKSIEAFPGCALRQGDRLEPVGGGSVAVEGENGVACLVTETADVSSLYQGAAQASRGGAGISWAAIRKQLGARSVLASSAVALTVVAVAVIVVFDPFIREQWNYQAAYLPNQRHTPEMALPSNGTVSGGLEMMYDPTNGTVSGGDIWRVKDGGAPRLAPIISCIPDIIISDADQKSADRNLFIFENALNLDELVRDDTAASLLKWSFVEPTPRGGVGWLLGSTVAVSESTTKASPSTAASKSPAPTPKTAPSASTTEKRLVIYTAQFSILVGSVADSMKDLLQKIEKWNGYVQTADLQRVTFRVPAANFNRVVEEVSQLGVVTNKQVQAQDVTRQYMDLQLRIEVAETSRKRLLALLEEADKTEDLLKIENEIRRLTEEIERLKGELRTVADQVVYSTIAVDLTAKAAEAKPARPRGGRSYFAWINQIGAEHVIRTF